MIDLIRLEEFSKNWHCDALGFYSGKVDVESDDLEKNHNFQRIGGLETFYYYEVMDLCLLKKQGIFLRKTTGLVTDPEEKRDFTSVKRGC